MYQVYPRSFADGDGDGVGDLRGLTGKLDHLASLGVEAVWVTPFFRSPMVDGGYDIADHRDVDPLFGTLADVDELIEGLHRRGMKLILDVVLNHTSSRHPWFQASRRGRDDPKHDWYWWRPARDGAVPGEPGAEPTNWTSYFSEPAWQYDEEVGLYYLHLFARDQPDLNWENPEVRDAMYAMLDWWLDRGADGFRMDVVNLISKELPLRDGRPFPGRTLGDGTPFFQNGPRIHEFLHELHTRVIAPRDREIVTIGEMLGVTLDEAQLYTDPARGELDMVFQFEHVALDRAPHDRFERRPLSLVALKRSLARWQAGLADRGWNSLYWSNHDQPRAVSRFGSEAPEFRETSAKLLGTVLHLHRGTPFVYQGEELGMTNHPFETIEDFRDVASLNYHRLALARGDDEAELLRAMRAMSRDTGRGPMQWTGEPGAGFTTGTPWLPVNPDHVDVNVAAQEADPHSVLNHYRRLIRLRHELPVVARGDFRMLLPDDERIYAFTRRLDDVELLVVANFGSRHASFDLEDGDAWTGSERILTTHTREPDGPAFRTLRPWEARVHRRLVR